MVELLDDEALNVEERSALVLLLLHTIDEMADGGGLSIETLSRVRWKLRSDGEILKRMRFYWSRLAASAPVTMALS